MSSYEIKNLVVKHYAGSLAYGTNLPTSDVDVRGIFCASPEEIRTPFHPVREVTLPDEEDGKLYELSNFLHLYTQGNPNILESLWVDVEDIIEDSSAYVYLREHAEELLSKKVAFTFTGYAVSQLKRIKGHNKWLMNPQPKEPPKHKDYLKMVLNLSEEKIMPRDFNIEIFSDLKLTHYGNNIFGLVNTFKGAEVLTSNGDFNISSKQQCDIDKSGNTPTIIFKYLDDEYRKAKDIHKNYWNWVKNRNDSRHELEEKFGYDTKHAMHLVRLLRMGEEILSGKGVIVKRPDAKELLDIRAGLWDYDDLVKWAEEKDKYIRGELYQNSKLPKSPDLKFGCKLLMTAQDLCWESK
jgi:predicted nucleotidyltransferase